MTRLDGRPQARRGQVTSASTHAMGDHAVTMTVARLPLALVTLPVPDLTLVATVLGFVALMPTAYADAVHGGAAEHGVQQWQVLSLLGLLLAYVASCSSACCASCRDPGWMARSGAGSWPMSPTAVNAAANRL